jgi:hypothetical protein
MGGHIPGEPGGSMDLSRLNPNSAASKAAGAGTYINRALRGAGTSADELSRAGWHATLETGASVGSRVTATRLLAGGVLAFAAKKVTGDLYVIFTAPDGSDQHMATVPAKSETGVRHWIMKYNRGEYQK